MFSSFLSFFNYSLHGSSQKPKLIFLHGLTGTAANWRRIISAYEAEFEILVFDQRGHRKSIKPDFGYAPEDYADDLAKITEELGWKEFFLVGHSMGGRNAQAFAHKFAHRVKRLVIEDIGPDQDLNGPQKIRQLFAKVPTPFKDKKTAKAFLMTEFGDSLLGAHLYSNLEEKSEGRGFDWQFSVSAMIETVEKGRVKDRWEEFQTLAVPTLLIRGQNSDELSRMFLKNA